MFIMITVSIVLSSLVLGSYFKKQISNKLELKRKLSEDLNYSIDFALSQAENYYDSLILNGPSFISISKSPWGIYNTISVKANYRGLKNAKTVMTSQIISNKNIPVLIVKNSRNVVSLTGNTIINGNVYVPKAYMERAYVEGKTFTKKQLVNGRILSIKSYRSVFDNLSFVKRFNGILNSCNLEQLYISSLLADSITVSFADDTKLVYAKKEIILDNIVITGNVIIRSDSLVSIRNSCDISNAIIIAPIINIEEGFIGAIQLIASDSINIGARSELLFPSALILYKSDSRAPTITINKDCKIHGLVYAYMPNSASANSLISVKNNTEIIGHIYSNSRVDFKGIMNGALICDKIIARTNSSYYEDVLIDAKFENNRVPNFMIAGFAFGKEDNEQVLFEL